MKKCFAFALALAITLSLAACGREESPLSPFDQEDISQEMRDATRRDWEEWDAKDKTAQMLSSTLPGHQHRDFESWQEMEEFLGFSVNDPLADVDWLERGTYVGLPLGTHEAAPVVLNWSSSPESVIQTITLNSGYAADPLRVTLAARLFGEEEDRSISILGSDLEEDVVLDFNQNSEPQVISRQGEQYFAQDIYFPLGNALYQISVIGAPELKEQTVETAEKMLKELN